MISQFAKFLHVGSFANSLWDGFCIQNKRTLRKLLLKKLWLGMDWEGGWGSRPPPTGHIFCFLFFKICLKILLLGVAEVCGGKLFQFFQVAPYKKFLDPYMAAYQNQTIHI